MLLSCHGIIKEFGDKMVLNGVHLDIKQKSRIGLVGRNGSGKTTLANILAGEIECDKGQLHTGGKQLNIGYLRQTESQLELILHTLNNEGEINREFQRQASYLGMKGVRQWSPDRWQALSGGEKTKLALAQVWASRPDLIILDEPTNHMDYQGVNHLMAELSRYPGAAVIISHDRYFLDQTVKEIAELEQGMIKLYPGNYSSYREARQKERESRLHVYQSQQKKQKEIEANIARLKGWSEKGQRESRVKGKEIGMGGKEYFRNKVKKRDQAIKSQIKRLEKMRQEGEPPLNKELAVKVDFNDPEKGGRRLLEADSISKAYGSLSLFAASSFYINRGEKIGIIGPNGCGKTTLFKIMLGQESLDRGSLFLSPKARVGYVSQELPTHEKESLIELIRDWPKLKQQRTIELLAGLGVAYDRLLTARERLSRGERMKIALGLAIIEEGDLLMLDEPTNHLDLYSREALEGSLSRFSGSIILISHDRYLLDQVCDHLLVFAHGKIQRLEAKASEYLTQKEKPASLVPKQNNKDELLLLETKISRILGELSRMKPGEAAYLALEQEYAELIRQRGKIEQGTTPVSFR